MTAVGLLALGGALLVFWKARQQRNLKSFTELQNQQSGSKYHDEAAAIELDEDNGDDDDEDGEAGESVPMVEFKTNPSPPTPIH